MPVRRSASWNRPKTPTELAARVPSAADLMPMLTGEPDDRISSIKQWIINLDYDAKSRSDSGSAAVICNFFEAFCKLTTGLNMKEPKIDTGSMEISVETDGGRVPLEAVSQGTASVLCWIGTLIQRCSETRKTDQAALLLIDEIDAHMHPKWQQSFVDAFREQFPNVQIIATTHSPFVVANMDTAPSEETPEVKKPDQVVVFLRQEGVLSQARWKERLKGLRIDQIVTLPIFGLDSARDRDSAQALATYNELSVKDTLTEEENEKLKRSAGVLKMKPHPAEREEARRASALIEEALKDKIAQLPDDIRSGVVRELKIQTQESITGERRPE